MPAGNTYIPKYDLLNNTLAIEFRTSEAYIPAHWHSALEIIYLLDGQADITVEGSTLTMVKGEFAVIDTGRIHEYHCPSDFRQLIIHIDDACISSYMDNRRNFQILCDRTELTEDRVDLYLAICASLEELSRYWISRPEGYRILCESFVLRILYELISHFSIPLYRDDLPEPSKEQRRIREIVTYIAENYDKSISLDEISARFGLSSEYFSRFFTRKIGIPFKKHLNQVRLSHIYHDLCSSDTPIMEIADRHGFSNYKLFNRMFKEIYGTTPRELRRRIAQLQ